jgi:hypothetical protein
MAAGAGIALVPASASKFNQGGVDTSATLADFISAA